MVLLFQGFLDLLKVRGEQLRGSAEFGLHFEFQTLQDSQSWDESANLQTVEGEYQTRSSALPPSRLQLIPLSDQQPRPSQ